MLPDNRSRESLIRTDNQEFVICKLESKIQNPMSSQDLTDRLKAEALRLGFDQVGIAPAVVAPGYPDFLRWLDSGYAATMDYLERQEPSRSNPANLLEGVRSIIVVSVVYGANDAGQRAERTSPVQGRVARYARGVDYHRVLWDKLGLLLDWLKLERPTARGARWRIPPPYSSATTPGSPELAGSVRIPC